MITNTSVTHLTPWLTAAALEVLSLAPPHFLKITEREANSEATPHGGRLPWGTSGDLGGTDSTASEKSPEVTE